jgi:hypothetical protein|tara:strand:+ start:192 stop:422 length:231 start_codon:yes stop_codon:yes gene_type:complete
MSDEADRRRTYRELEKRGQPTPGKYYGKRKPTEYAPKKKPKVKQLDLFKKKAGGYTVTNRYSDIMLPEKKRTTRIT